MTVGERIREERKAQGLNREQLAVKAGVSFGTVANVERGESSQTRIVEALAAALGVSVSKLYQDAEKAS